MILMGLAFKTSKFMVSKAHSAVKFKILKNQSQKFKKKNCQNKVVTGNLPRKQSCFHEFFLLIKN